MRLYIITVVLLLACCILISALIIRSYRRNMVNQYDVLLQKLDQAIAGQNLETSYDESQPTMIPLAY